MVMAATQPAADVDWKPSDALPDGCQNQPTGSVTDVDPHRRAGSVEPRIPADNARKSGNSLATAAEEKKHLTPLKR